MLPLFQLFLHYLSQSPLQYPVLYLRRVRHQCNPSIVSTLCFISLFIYGADCCPTPFTKHYLISPTAVHQLQHPSCPFISHFLQHFCNYSIFSRRLSTFHTSQRRHHLLPRNQPLLLSPSLQQIRLSQSLLRYTLHIVQTLEKSLPPLVNLPLVYN